MPPLPLLATSGTPASQPGLPTAVVLTIVFIMYLVLAHEVFCDRNNSQPQFSHL